MESSVYIVHEISYFMGAIFYNSIAYHPFFDTLVDFYFQIKTILNTPNHEVMDLSPQLLSDHRRNH